MIRYHIRHVTTYEYAEPVSLCQNVAHLALRPCDRQRAESTSLTICPEPAVIDERVDYFGNPVHYFTVQEPHRELAVRADHVVDVFPREPAGVASAQPWFPSTLWFAIVTDASETPSKLPKSRPL